MTSILIPVALVSAIGFVLAAVFVMLQKLFDITIRSEEDIAHIKFAEVESISSTKSSSTKSAIGLWIYSCMSISIIQ